MKIDVKPYNLYNGNTPVRQNNRDGVPLVNWFVGTTCLGTYPETTPVPDEVELHTIWLIGWDIPICIAIGTDGSIHGEALKVTLGEARRAVKHANEQLQALVAALDKYEIPHE